MVVRRQPLAFVVDTTGSFSVQKNEVMLLHRTTVDHHSISYVKDATHQPTQE
jgi:hypothetical protein